MLLALEEAAWLKSRVDTAMFPTVQKSRSKTAIEFLDAVKVDLEPEFTGKFPMPLFNYQNLFMVLIVLSHAMEEQTQDITVEYRDTLRQHLKGKEPWFHNTVMKPAFIEM